MYVYTHIRVIARGQRHMPKFILRRINLQKVTFTFFDYSLNVPAHIRQQPPNVIYGRIANMYYPSVPKHK